VAGKILYPVYFLYALMPVCFASVVIETAFVILKNISTGEVSMLVQAADENQIKQSD
jgi:hypothetical protein